MGLDKIIDVDISDLKDGVEKARTFMSQQNFQKLIYRTVSETGKHVKAIVGKDVPPFYEASKSWVQKGVQSPQTSFGNEGLGVTCVIPLEDKRGTAGGKFKATGGTYAPRKGRRQKIYIRTVKGKKSLLPEKMANQGGNPPFRVRGGSAKGMVFTRRTKERLPIVRVVGLGTPQMPANLAQPRVKEDIFDYMRKRLEHNFHFMSGGLKL